jgi:large subunit ribosomal protein L2
MKLARYKAMRTHIRRTSRLGGHNHHGRITVPHQGGGHKQHYRKIDWCRSNGNGVVVNIEYDPQRTAFLAKLYHEGVSLQSNAYSYIIAPKGVKVFDRLHALREKRRNFFLRSGDASLLSNFEPGDFVHNVEAVPGQGGLFARAAGSFCQVLQHSSEQYVKLRLPSGSQRLISVDSFATMGIVGREDFLLRNLEKAGRSRWLNRRPSVRGVAMNPVDHPHGGGQGKTSGGRPSVTPKGWPTKGQPTRSKKRRNSLILTSRRK